MSIIAHIATGGIVQHVLNRGNGRMDLFHKPADYAAFADLSEGPRASRVGVMILTKYALTAFAAVGLAVTTASSASAALLYSDNFDAGAGPTGIDTASEAGRHSGTYPNAIVLRSAKIP